MRRILGLALTSIILSALAVAPVTADEVETTGQTLPGIDVLVSNDFDVLRNKAVGLITNHTGISRSGKSDIDILNESKKVNLVALFSPEHGIRGTADEKVGSGTDEQTGLPIHSLYGKTRKPSPEMLQGIDVLVFDIQDIGTRFYTYIGTMALAMQAAKEEGIAFVVLDRPNVIGGDKVEGAIPPQDLCGGITCIYPIPTRHGMTIGELARLFNDHFGIGCDLSVVKMCGWSRSMYFDETGLIWRNPSPNMKTMTGAILYPGLGVAETTTLSCGRGTDIPFEIYGAPYVDADMVAGKLKELNIPGIEFEPVTFTPTAKYHKFQNEECHGVKATITDRDGLDVVVAGLYMIQAFQESSPEKHEELGGFKTETGDPETWKMLTGEKMKPEEIVARWQPKIDEFKAIRAKYLLY